MSDQGHFQGSQMLINFLGHFTGLLEKQLSVIRQTMLTTVDQVMESVNHISESTGTKRMNAEEALEKTYFSPDIETQVLVEDMQKMVTDLFDEAQSRLERGEDLDALTSSEPSVLLQSRIKRFESKFHHEMVNLTNLDENLKSALFGIMGALSSEDVIAQRMDHVIVALKVLQTGLNHVLIDYSGRCTAAELEKVTTDIKRYTFREYTCEEEKEEFFEFFPETRSAS